MKKILYVLGGIIVGVGLVSVFIAGQKSQVLGSVERTGEYHATSTAPNTAGYLYATSPFLVKTGAGTFGSIIVTKAGTAGGVVNIYNATTTNVNKRTGNMATTTIILASLPTDLAAGTYTFDVSFTYGLLVEWIGTIGTSTITWR